jgi:hypothetical protein
MSTSPFEHLYQEELYLLPSRTLVLLDKPWEQLSETDQALLVKILNSVKLSLAAVQIVHCGDVSINDVEQWSPKRVISFGVGISPVQKFYESFPVNGLPVILSHGLSALDDAKKKNLWLALKQMFGI